MSNDNYAKLGAICEFINGDRGKNYPSGNDFVNEGVPFINAGHLQNNKIDFKNMNYISKDKFEILGSGKIKKSDILYCLRGSLGKNAVVDVEEGAIASSLLILRPKKNIVSTNYLMQYLNSKEIYEQMIKSNNGSSQPNLSATSVKEFNIYLPNYEIQKKISDVLEKAKDLMDKRKAQLEGLDELIKSVFYDMFGDPVKNQRKITKLTIDDIKSSERYAIVDGPFGSSLKSEEYVEEGIPVIRINNIKPNRFFDKEYKYITEKKYKELIRSKIDKGDILIARVGNTIGKSCIFNMDYKALLSTTGVCKINCDKEKINNIFLVNQLNLQSYRKYINNNIQGAGQPCLNLTTIKSFEIIVPEVVEQIKFATIVENIEKQKELIQQSLTQLENNFNVIMQKAFNGELFIK